MRKNYIVPQSEVIDFRSEGIMEDIGIVRHSGGGGGFNDEWQVG